MRSQLLFFVLASATAALSLAVGCGDDDATTAAATSGDATTTTAATTSATTGSGGSSTDATTTTTGVGGAGGMGATTGTGGGSTTSTTGAGGATTGEHLMISEVVVTPGPAELVEIWNPTGSAVDLSNYYLSDNSTYHTVAVGMPWAPITDNPGTDFLAQFPAGTMLAAGAVIVVATDPGYEATYGKCADFILAAADVPCAVGSAKAMVAPANGDLGTAPGTLLSNSREMVVLFQWDGDTTHPLVDVDYVTWGATFEDGTRVDKTAVAGYAADTAPASQDGAAAPGVNQSVERCEADTGEKTSGGNGINGHDETSEQLGTSFVLQVAPTPGVKNACL